MNGIERILVYIKAQSDAECAEIDRAASEDCARIRAEYSQKEQDEYWKMISEGTKDVERRLERLNSLAVMESKKQVLTTQQEMLSLAFEHAVNRLSSLDRSEYVAFLARQASAASLTGTEEIILSPAERDVFGQDVCSAANGALSASGKTAALTLSGRTAGIRGGLILSGGDIETDCSIDALIAEHRSALSPAVASILFE